MKLKLQHNNNKFLLGLILTILYVVEYDFVYKNFVFHYFSYASINYNNIGNGEYCLLLIQACIPYCFYRGFRNIGDAFCVFVYLFVYIPFVESLHVAGIPFNYQFVYGLSFCIIMIIFFTTNDRYYFYKGFSNFSNKGKVSFRTFELIVLVVFGICVLMNIGNIQFVNFLTDSGTIYEIRGNAKSILNGYIIVFLTRALIPVALVYSVIKKDKIRTVLYLVLFIVMFMINLEKITFLISFIMVIFAFFYVKFKAFFENNFYSIIVVSVLFLSYGSYLLSSNTITFSISTLVLLRTQCIAGEQLDRYFHFFILQDNPFTYYTQISFLRRFSGLYPYPLSIGEMVAGDEGGNSNATFLLMDGVASAGVLGCYISCALFVFVKGLMNSIGLRYNNMYVVIIMFGSIMAMLNTSLFTSLISYGLLPIWLILFFVNAKCLQNK